MRTVRDALCFVFGLPSPSWVVLVGLPLHVDYDVLFILFYFSIFFYFVPRRGVVVLISL